MTVRWLFRNATPFWCFILDLWFRTLRIDVGGTSPVDGDDHILAFWHSQLLLPVLLNRGKNYTALVSASEDGQVLNRILRKLGYSVVEGSSSKGGFEAALRLMRSAKLRIMVTPDGPRGPAAVAKPGAIFLAESLNIPVVPVIVHCSRSIKLNTWDRMEIPAPFSRCRVTCLQPWVPSKTSRNEQAINLQALLNGMPLSNELVKTGTGEGS